MRDFQCVLLGNIHPAVICTPDVNTKIASLIYPGLSFWHASVVQDPETKGIQNIGKRLQLWSAKQKLGRKKSEVRKNSDREWKGNGLMDLRF